MFLLYFLLFSKSTTFFFQFYFKIYDQDQFCIFITGTIFFKQQYILLHVFRLYINTLFYFKYHSSIFSITWYLRLREDEIHICLFDGYFQRCPFILLLQDRLAWLQIIFNFNTILLGMVSLWYLKISKPEI